MNSDCDAKHGIHLTKDLNVALSGKNSKVFDIPGFVPRFQTGFKLRVFDWQKYANTPGYCPADDALSQSIDLQGVWEAFETVLVLDILDLGKKEKDVIVDIGCNVGWYSLIAGVKGYIHQIAYECDKDIIELFEYNCRLNHVNIDLRKVKINDDVAKLKIPDQREIHFLKCDIEGMERFAINMCADLFKEKRIKYAMIEVSPCFNDSYPELCGKIVKWGYKAFRVPNKGMKHMAEYEVQPLETLKKHYKVDASTETEWRDYLKTIHQDDFIFIREDLV